VYTTVEKVNTSHYCVLLKGPDQNMNKKVTVYMEYECKQSRKQHAYK